MQRQAASPGGDDVADATVQIMTLDDGSYDPISEANQEGDSTPVPQAASPTAASRPTSRSRPRSASGTSASPEGGHRRYPFDMGNHKLIGVLPSPVHPTPGRSMGRAGSRAGTPATGAASRPASQQRSRSAASFGVQASKHTQARLLGSTHKPTIHFLPDCAEAGDPATRAAVMHEWIASYQEEDAAYSSVVVKNMAKLKRASVFGARLESPNTLETAVAFEVLEEIGNVFGRCVLHVCVGPTLCTNAHKAMRQLSRR